MDWIRNYVLSVFSRCLNWGYSPNSLECQEANIYLIVDYLAHMGDTSLLPGYGGGKHPFSDHASSPHVNLSRQREINECTAG